jgi:hypothetical protein
MKTDEVADAKAAHEFLTELRTRISTQPLPYQYGVNARALTSLWEVFTHRVMLCAIIRGARTLLRARPKR